MGGAWWLEGKAEAPLPADGKQCTVPYSTVQYATIPYLHLSLLHHLKRLSQPPTWLFLFFSSASGGWAAYSEYPVHWLHLFCLFFLQLFFLCLIFTSHLSQKNIHTFQTSCALCPYCPTSQDTLNLNYWQQSTSPATFCFSSNLLARLTSFSIGPVPYQLFDPGRQLW